MMRSKVYAPAKLTWSLHVGRRTPTGLHEIDAEMLTLDLADELVITEPGHGLVISADEASRAGELDPGGDNLVARALAAASREASVELIKRIPMGGGLGGGSADAGAVLRWAEQFDPDIALGLGSDVPFCVRGGRARVRGLGDEVEPLEFVERNVVLVVPPIHVDTGAVYRAFDEIGPGNGSVRNDLEAAAFAVAPELGAWRAWIQAATGTAPILAGSGSTFFIEGTKAELGLDGIDFVDMDGATGLVRDARSVPEVFGAPASLR
jgi:4-diphosphocytidyl-2-C-methyl-D-erythritol kinase